MINLYLLKLKTLSDEMDYIMLQASLEEKFLHVFIHFLHTKIRTIKFSMGFLEYDASNISTLGDVYPSLASQ
jgi:hypothetical protein